MQHGMVVTGDDADIQILAVIGDIVLQGIAGVAESQGQGPIARNSIGGDGRVLVVAYGRQFRRAGNEKEARKKKEGPITGGQTRGAHAEDFWAKLGFRRMYEILKSVNARKTPAMPGF